LDIENKVWYAKTQERISILPFVCALCYQGYVLAQNISWIVVFKCPNPALVSLYF
jgi:hypothetical protein